MRPIVGLSVVAIAATLAAQPVSAAAPSFDWSGFYAGAQLGWGFVNAHASDSKLDPNGFGTDRSGSGSKSFNGIVWGGDLGANWMLSPNVVAGVEGDFSGADLTLHYTGVSVDGTSYKTDRINWYSTLRGRIGYASGNWLAYATAGAAWTQIYLRNVQGPCGDSDPTCASSPVPLGATETFTHTRGGWALGAGFQVGFAPGWTSRLQYLHMDFGRFNQPYPTFNRLNKISMTTDLVEVGVNYSFGGF